MSNRTPQQLADQLNSLRAQAVTIVEGTIASAANPGGSITFTYTNPIDGQPYTATGTAWNQCVPSKVSALKQTDGTWIVVGQHEAAIVREAVHTDRRARSQPETGGKIKVLYSVIDGDQRVFYVGGDRAVPKRIGSIPAARFVKTAKISNTGKGNHFVVGLQHEDGSAFPYELASVMTKTITGQTSWDVVYTPYSELFRAAYLNPYYVDHGLWTQAIPNFNTLGINAVFNSFSQYLGDVRLVAGGMSSLSEPDLLISAQNAIAPNIDKFSSALYRRGSVGRDQNVDLRNPAILGKMGRSAIYSHEVDNSFLGEVAFYQERIFVNCKTLAETTLGGDMLWLSDSTRSLNLIGSQAYLVNLPGTSLDPIQRSLVIPESLWMPTQAKKLSVDIYDLGTATTKRSIDANVLGIKGNAQIYSLSYHP